MLESTLALVKHCGGIVHGLRWFDSGRTQLLPHLSLLSSLFFSLTTADKADVPENILLLAGLWVEGGLVISRGVLLAQGDSCWWKNYADSQLAHLWVRIELFCTLCLQYFSSDIPSVKKNKVKMINAICSTSLEFCISLRSAPMQMVYFFIKEDERLLSGWCNRLMSPSNLWPSCSQLYNMPL